MKPADNLKPQFAVLSLEPSLSKMRSDRYTINDHLVSSCRPVNLHSCILENGIIDLQKGKLFLCQVPRIITSQHPQTPIKVLVILCCDKTIKIKTLQYHIISTNSCRMMAFSMFRFETRRKYFNRYQQIDTSMQP